MASSDSEWFIPIPFFLGLMMVYRHGNFSIVYPVAYALPILFLAFFDLGRGRFPSMGGWLGIILIMIGCILAPLTSLGTIKLSDYWNSATIWMLVIMLAIVASNATDKLAVEMLTPGAITSARYALLQAIFTVPFLWIVLKLMGEAISASPGIAAWKWPALFAIFVFTSYWLMLWAFQLAPYLSYLSALRQFSLVIGVILAAVVLHEEVPKMRIFSAVIIVLGIICLSLAH